MRMDRDNTLARREQASVAEAVRLLVELRKAFERLDGNVLAVYLLLWDQAGARPGSIELELSVLCSRLKRSRRTVEGNLDVLASHNLVQLGRALGDRQPVRVISVGEASRSLRAQEPPADEDPQCWLPGDWDEAPALVDQLPEEPSIVAFPGRGEFGAELPGEYGAGVGSSAQNSPGSLVQNSPATCDRRNVANDGDLRGDLEGRGDSGTPVAFKDHPPIQIPYPSNHPSHPLSPIPPEGTDPPLQLTAAAADRAARWLRADRSELGQSIIDDAAALWRALETTFDATDGWLPVYAVYLRHVEGGLTHEELGRPARAMRRNAKSCKAAYWVRAFQNLLTNRRRPIAWPSIEALRDEFVRIGVGWDPRWDEAWKARKEEHDRPQKPRGP